MPNDLSRINNKLNSEKYIQHVAEGKYSFQSATGVYCFIVTLYCSAMRGVVMLCYLVARSNTCVFLRLLHILLNTTKGGDTPPSVEPALSGFRPPQEQFATLTNSQTLTRSILSCAISDMLTLVRISSQRHMDCYSCVKATMLCEYVKLMPCRHKGVIFVMNTTKELSF